MHAWFAIAALLPVVACQRSPAPASATVTETSRPAQAATQAGAGSAVLPKPVPAELPAVVARVNGEPIGRQEFEQAVESLEARIGGSVPAERRDAVFRDLLDQLVAYHLLAQEAKARRFTVDPNEVAGELARLGKQFPDEATFQQALAARQLTVEGLRAQIERDLLVGKLLETEVGATVTVGEAEVATFYQQHQDRFQEPESMQASHILIRVEPGADPATRRRAHERAEAVLKQARSGADFAALAREFSEDPGSAAAGGDLGFFARGQMVPAFEAAAFALKPGELSALVESPFGLHIIKAGAHRPARTVPLAEVRDEIRTYLAQQQRQEKLGAYVERLKARAKIEILF